MEGVDGSSPQEGFSFRGGMGQLSLIPHSDLRVHLAYIEFGARRLNRFCRSDRLARVAIVEDVPVDVQRDARRVPHLAGDLDHGRSGLDEQRSGRVTEIVWSAVSDAESLDGRTVDALSTPPHARVAQDDE
jgi:hypothetical protein